MCAEGDLSPRRERGRRGAPRALTLAVLALGALLLADAARALEPITVSVEGAIALDPETEGRARELALEAALVEATLQAARSFLPEDVVRYEEERMREALGPVAASAILTYRLDAEIGRRRSRAAPGGEEYAVRLTATVDTEQVRARLQEAGIGAQPASKPSVLVLARRQQAGGHTSQVALTLLEDHMKRRLEEAGFPLVEPALRTPSGGEQGLPAEIGRALGADVALDLAAGWTEKGIGDRVIGGVADVRVRALRVADRAQLGSSRFDVPAYHDDPMEAQMRAMESVGIQIAQNVILQLEQNWEALNEDERPLVIHLSNVSALAQVEHVRDRLRAVLDSGDVEIAALSPRSAELVVRADVSPGALQEQLAASAFDGFRLEPVDLTRERLDLRIAGSVNPGSGTVPASSY